MPYPDNYVFRYAPDSEPPLYDDDAPEPITAAEAARFEIAARPYRAVLAALNAVADAFATASAIASAIAIADAAANAPAPATAYAFNRFLERP